MKGFCKYSRHIISKHILRVSSKISIHLKTLYLISGKTVSNNNIWKPHKINKKNLIQDFYGIRELFNLTYI